MLFPASPINLPNSVSKALSNNTNTAGKKGLLSNLKPFYKHNLFLPIRIDLTKGNLNKNESVIKDTNLTNLTKEIVNQTTHVNSSSNINAYITGPQQNGFNLTTVPSFSNKVDKVCGVPGICKSSSFLTCYNTPLSSCDDCSSAASGIFAFLVILFSLAILIGNFLIIAVQYQNSRRNRSTNRDVFKTSLALADMLIGLELLVIVLPNYVWTMKQTAEEIILEQDILQGSVPAVAGGIFYLLCYTSSLYHLVYLGTQRLYAIVWPIRYKLQTRRSIYLSLMLVWILAAVAAASPAFFPQHFNFNYVHVIFLYFPILAPYSHDVSFAPAIVMLFLLLLLPYLLMTSTSILTAILGCRQLKLSRMRVLGGGSSRNEADKFSSTQFSLFKTVALMQLGFTLTLIPLAIVVGLLYSGYLDCSSVSTAYLICFYIRTTNSLVNVLVYSVRDRSFRSSVSMIFKCCNLKTKQHHQQRQLCANSTVRS